MATGSVLEDEILEFWDLGEIKKSENLVPHWVYGVNVLPPCGDQVHKKAKIMVN